MINPDMALMRDLKDYMMVDEDGNEGAVNFTFNDESNKSYYCRRQKKATLPSGDY